MTFVAPKSNSEYVYIGDFCVAYAPIGNGIGYRLSPFWGVQNDAPNFKKFYMHNSKFWYISGNAGDKIIGLIEDDENLLIVDQIDAMTGKTQAEPVDV